MVQPWVKAHNLFKTINGGDTMPKNPIQATYTAEGVKGLLSEGGSRHRDAAAKAIKSAGGKVEANGDRRGRPVAVRLLQGAPPRFEPQPNLEQLANWPCPSPLSA